MLSVFFVVINQGCGVSRAGLIGVHPLLDCCREVDGMSEPWELLNSGPGEPAFNMALDEVLLSSARRIGHPVLRFYGWTQRAASFGYFQKIAEVECVTVLRPLIRRPTGGGLVPHDADWTYSVVIPAGHEWHRSNAGQSHRRMHEWIRRAFEEMGIPTELAQDSRQAAPGECFVGHEVHDVLWQGRKIAGAAQRRTRNGLLIQGSVQPPPLNLHRLTWQQAMCEVADAEWNTEPPDAQMLNEAERLAAEKYAREAYNRTSCLHGILLHYSLCCCGYSSTHTTLPMPRITGCALTDEYEQHLCLKNRSLQIKELLTSDLQLVK